MGVKTRFDFAALEESFTKLIEELGESLDACHQLGFTEIFPRQEPLRQALGLQKKLEEDLLLQWKIYQDQGMEALQSHQNRWLFASLRNENSLWGLWARWTQALAQAQADSEQWLAENPWQSYLLGLLIDPELVSPWRRATAQSQAWEQLLSAWLKLMGQDLSHQALSFLNLIELGAKRRPDPLALEPLTPQLKGAIAEVTQALLANPSAEQAARALDRFWAQSSGGPWSQYLAFACIERGAGFYFKPISQPKLARFEQLFGIEEQIQALQENTEVLLRGRKAQNCLLWGGRGTGKSSSVLALLRHYADQGLRLVELPAARLSHLPELFSRLAPLKEKFILYVDELGFEAEQEGFKALKVFLEGGLCPRPDNLILIATANRKSLVFQEPLDERYPQNRQRVNEERALDDRFGLKLFYPPPKYEALRALFTFFYKKNRPAPAEAALWLEFNRFCLANGHDEPNGRSLEQFFASL